MIDAHTFSYSPSDLTWLFYFQKKAVSDSDDDFSAMPVARATTGRARAANTVKYNYSSDDGDDFE